MNAKISKIKKEKPRRVLREYQKKMFRYLTNRKHAALFVEMRLGKTIVTIRRAKTIQPREEMGGVLLVLIVAPLSALDSWENELTAEGQKKIYHLFGTKKQREKQLSDLSTVDRRNPSPVIRWALANKELSRTIPEIDKVKFDFVVLDESTFIKSPSTNRTRFFCQFFRAARHRVILTGTPAPESPLNYFTQLQFIDPSILPFKNFWIFRAKCFRISWGNNWELTKQGRVVLETALSENVFILSRKDVGLECPKVREIRKFDLSPASMRIYKMAEKNFVFAYLQKAIDAGEIPADESDILKIMKTTDNAAVKFLWLRIIAGGFNIDEMGRFHLADYHKIRELFEIITGELAQQKIVVYCSFLHELTAIKNQLTFKKIKSEVINGSVPYAKRRTIFEDFRNGKFKILLCQCESVRTGANLSCADTIIYYSAPLGAETRIQGEARIDDVLDKTPKLIIDLMARGTVDEQISAGTIRKKSMSAIILNAVKTIQIKHKMKG